jgi:3-dehydroquinate synthetase
MFLDKKTSDNQLNFVLINNIGEAFIKKDVNKEHLLYAIQMIRKD